MLVLTRKIGETIAIGDEIKVTVMHIKGKQVRIGIKANRETEVHREEVYQRIQLDKAYPTKGFTCSPEAPSQNGSKDSKV